MLLSKTKLIKYVVILCLILGFICGLLSNSEATETWVEDPRYGANGYLLTENDMKRIMDSIALTETESENYVITSGDIADYTTQFNNWSTNYHTDNPTFSLKDTYFYRCQTNTGSTARKKLYFVIHGQNNSEILPGTGLYMWTLGFGTQILTNGQGLYNILTLTENGSYYNCTYDSSNTTAYAISNTEVATITTLSLAPGMKFTITAGNIFNYIYTDYIVQPTENTSQTSTDTIIYATYSSSYTKVKPNWFAHSVGLQGSGDFIDDDNGGGTVTPSGDTPSGDNDTLSGIANSVDNIDNFLNSPLTTTSGEFASGFNVDSSEVDDKMSATDDFFSWLFGKIKDAFSVDSNQTLTITILDKDFVLNSDDHIINIPIFTTVIGTGLNCFLLYAIVKDIRKEINKVKEGKFAEIAKDDISADMM